MRQGIVRRVADVALRIEPDRGAVLEWILHTPLPSLGGRPPSNWPAMARANG